jgi:hypothetical protein
MAYKQSPGRQAMPKTGRGIPPVLMSGSPMKQEKELEKDKKVSEAAKRTVKSFASNKKLGKRDLDIEFAAAKDSIVSRNKAMKTAGRGMSETELADIGNKAANLTRKANESSVTVEKGKQDVRTGKIKYNKKPVK